MPLYGMKTKSEHIKCMYCEHIQEIAGRKLRWSFSHSSKSKDILMKIKCGVVKKSVS